MPSYYEPQNFLEFADQLLSDKRYEEQGRLRTAIGRAYYAAFLSTKKKLEEIGFSFRDVERIHREVIEALMNLDYSMGDRLEALRNYRVDADYKMEASITPLLGISSVKLSQIIIDSVTRLRR